MCCCWFSKLWLHLKYLFVQLIKIWFLLVNTACLFRFHLSRRPSFFCYDEGNKLSFVAPQYNWLTHFQSPISLIFEKVFVGQFEILKIRRTIMAWNTSTLRWYRVWSIHMFVKFHIYLKNYKKTYTSFINSKIFWSFLLELWSFLSWLKIVWHLTLWLQL